MKFTHSYIAGQWRDGPDVIPVLDPATDETICEITSASEGDCIDAVGAAHDAGTGWSRTPPRERAEILRRAFELMSAEEDSFALLISRENGKALPDARSEWRYAAEFFRWFAEEAVRVRGDYRLAPTGDKSIVVHHEPIGVSLLVTPWNFPAAMATRKIAPALAAGCTVVLKPASETPLTALAIVDLLERAGVPAGVVNAVVPNRVGPAVSRMLHDPRVTNLSFTGSTEVGRLLLHESADNVLRATMELGGNAPFLVLENADVEAAVQGAMIAKMRNGGAACTAANRFYVHRSVAAQFTETFAAEMARLVMGHGSDPSVRLGAMVSRQERDRVAGLVAAAVDDGAKCIVGGLVPEGPGAYYPATVLTDVSPSAAILKSEIFGPVAPIVLVDDDEEALRLANDTEFGLIAYVFDRELTSAMSMAKKLQAGMVALNRGVLSDPAAPFGGTKQSGLGREGGFEGIHEFLETKYIAADF